jgi:hypothetical protein
MKRALLILGLMILVFFTATSATAAGAHEGSDGIWIIWLIDEADRELCFHVVVETYCLSVAEDAVIHVPDAPSSGSLGDLEKGQVVLLFLDDGDNIIRINVVRFGR